MHISVSAEQIFSFFSWPVSNTMLTGWIATMLVVVAVYFATRKISLVPLGIQNFFEWMLEELFNLMNGIMEDRKTTLKFFPLIATFFIFILATNWLGLLPGFGSIGFFHGEEFTPLFRATNADLNTTLALAMVSVIVIQISGIASLGFFRYGRKFITFKSPMAFIIGVLELVSEITKIISFSFRLFGSILAGEILLTVMAFLAPYIVPLPFMGLEVFIGFIQAIVFSLLTLVFIKMARTEMEGH